MTLNPELLNRITRWEQEYVKGNKKPILDREYPPIRPRRDIVFSVEPQPDKLATATTVKSEMAENKVKNRNAGEASSRTSKITENTVKNALQHVDPAGANAEKEKGNEFFKKGDFRKAVEHYSASMALDPFNAVLPINRAMALLKLKRFAEAENDCSLGLKLDNKNVKALWRRGIARQSLGKLDDARKDFEDALKIDPTNKSVQDELAKLRQQRSAIPNVSTTKSKPDSVTLPSATATFTKRVSIRDVGNAEQSKLFKETTQRRVTTATAPASIIATTESVTLKSIVPAEAVVAAPSTRPAKASTTTPQAKKAYTQTLGPTASISDPPKPLVEPANISAPPKVIKMPSYSDLSIKMAPPTNSMEFQRDWRSYSRNNDMLYLYLKLIPVDTLPQLFKSSFESDHLSSILTVLNKYYTLYESPELIYNTLSSLVKVDRFSISLLFMSDVPDKKYLRDIFNQLHAYVGRSDSVFTKKDLSSLSAKYRI
ncbi:RNA polymerase II-associated protein 3 [Lobosporangium transversale]|nr:RNA polymerase II-associated protein 3 [Lobosporangium transversale]